MLCVNAQIQHCILRVHFKNNMKLMCYIQSKFHSLNLPLWLTSPPYTSSGPAVVLPGTVDPKKTPTTKRPSDLMFILPWWVQPAQSDFHWLALNWNCIQLNHPSHPRPAVETKAALIATAGPGCAPSPMHLAFLIGKELVCLHWLQLIELDPYSPPSQPG